MLMTRRSKSYGYGVELRADGPNREVDCIVCYHCGQTDWEHDEKGKRNDAIGARCTCCDQFICKQCIGKPCMPLHYRMDQWERRNQGLRYTPLKEIYEIFNGTKTDSRFTGPNRRPGK